MKKRSARIVVYFGLTCLTALVLSHPYIWQSIFGPKIKGEPLWAWQEEFRYQFHFKHKDKKWRTKIFDFLGMDSKPMSWVGYYPRKDLEMLPVLLSLANDSDEHVRGWVAHELAWMPPDEQTVATLIRMLGDSSPQVFESAIGSCGDVGPAASAAVPKLRDFFQHPEPAYGLEAAHSIIKIDGPSEELLGIVRESMRSSKYILRIIAIQRLNEATTGDEEIFAILLEKSRGDPKNAVRQESIYQLHKYGKKAVPHLIALLQSSPRIAHCGTVIRSLGRIGPDATAAIPALEKFVDDPDEEIRFHAARALEKIEPNRVAQK